MSGVEIAGLILGAFPIVIHTLEQYANGVQYVKRFWKYRREFESLIRRLELEVEIFRNTCEELLTGLVPADQITDILNDPAGPAWSDPGVEQLLKKRLQRSHTGYLCTVQNMIAAVEELKVRLRIDRLGEIPSDDPTSFRQMCRRLRFSFSRDDHADLMQRIKEGNNYLKRLTSQNLRLEPARTSQQRRKTPNFEVIRDCASSLLSALRIGFRCKCQAPHSINLLLQHRNDDCLERDKNKDQIADQLTFRITFNYGHRNCISNSVPWLWKCAHVKLVHHAEETPARGNINSTPKSEIANPATPVICLSRKPEKMARFAVTDSIKDHSSPDTSDPSEALQINRIADLCGAMIQQWPQHELAPRDSLPTRSVGYLLDSAKSWKHVVYPTTSAPLRSLSLAQAIRGSGMEQVTPLRMTDRKSLAVTLALSLLQLCGTPWLSTQWKLDDIIFIFPPDGCPYSKPHISKLVTSGKDPSSSEENGTPSDTPPVCPNIRNKFTFGLGILLIELCLGKAMEQLRTLCDVSSDGIEYVTDFRTATRLLEDVYEEAGGRYGDAVRRCIYCEFDQRKTTLEDPAFRHAVYQGVVRALEEDLAEFHCLV